MRRAWWEQAACRGDPLEAWFPTRGGTARAAYQRCRRICAACPVRTECLDEDLRAGECGHRDGMRAGLMPDERDAVERGDITAQAALDLALTTAEHEEEETMTVTDITPPPPPQLDPVDLVPTTAEALIEWGASHHSNRLQTLAGRARAALADLRTAAEREAAVAEAEQRVARLRAQLANAERDLKAAKGASTPAAKHGATADEQSDRRELAAIRAWANANGHQVAPRGIVARAVIEAYRAAHSPAPLAAVG